MELQEFVQQSIQEIVAGIKSAQEATHSDDGTRIVPAWDGKSSKHFNLEFDVAVVAEKKTSVEAGGKAKLYVANAGGKLNKQSSRSTANHIKFQIPIQYPAHVEMKQGSPSIVPGTERKFPEHGFPVR